MIADASAMEKRIMKPSPPKTYHFKLLAGFGLKAISSACLYRLAFFCLYRRNRVLRLYRFDNFDPCFDLVGDVRDVQPHIFEHLVIHCLPELDCVIHFLKRGCFRPLFLDKSVAAARAERLGLVNHLAAFMALPESHPLIYFVTNRAVF